MGLFAVGAHDASSGCRRAQSFISSNPGHIYACITWFRMRELHAVLINDFHWYSGVFTRILVVKQGGVNGQQTFRILVTLCSI